LLGLASSAALASSGINVDCNEVTEDLPRPELPSPSLNITVVDHGLGDVAADIQALPSEVAAEQIASPVLSDELELAEDSESGDTDSDSVGVPVSTPPETALRLPGVAEEDQPHFRRQMYRTDI
jgi:hypothetical protein